jgi:hypothetical protein
MKNLKFIVLAIASWALLGCEPIEVEKLPPPPKEVIIHITLRGIDLQIEHVNISGGFWVFVVEEPDAEKFFEARTYHYWKGKCGAGEHYPDHIVTFTGEVAEYLIGKKIEVFLAYMCAGYKNSTVTMESREHVDRRYILQEGMNKVQAPIKLAPEYQHYAW